MLSIEGNQVPPICGVDPLGLVKLVFKLLGLLVQLTRPAQEAFTHSSHCLEIHLCPLESEEIVQKVIVCVDFPYKHISYVFLLFNSILPSFDEVFVHFLLEGGVYMCIDLLYKEVKVDED